MVKWCSCKGICTVYTQRVTFAVYLYTEQVAVYFRRQPQLEFDYKSPRKRRITYAESSGWGGAGGICTIRLLVACFFAPPLIIEGQKIGK